MDKKHKHEYLVNASQIIKSKKVKLKEIYYQCKCGSKKTAIVPVKEKDVSQNFSY